MTQSPSVLYLSENARVDQGSRLYRCANQAKQLQQAGLSARVLHYEAARKADLDAADILVFSRVPHDDKALELIDLGRRGKKLLCGDLDDRYFTPWDVDNTGYLRSRARPRSSVSGRQAREQREVLQLLPGYEVVTAATPGIAEELETLGIPAHVTPNAFDSERFPLIERERTRLGRILMMSGTPTHDEDLRRIAPALAHFLAEHRDVQCTFLGAVSLAAPLLGLPNVKKQAILPVSELYDFVGQHDLCLVPLEDTLFNDCKSALKFIECGAVSVPVLASPRREYRGVIASGENGFLASDDPRSWYDTLERLHAAPGELRAAARGAHRSVAEQHTVKSQKTRLADYFTGLWQARGKVSAQKEVRP